MKTPWVEALAQKKKEKKEGEQQQQQNAVGAAKSGGSVDLTPRKMQDSYYRTVRDSFRLLRALLRNGRSDAD